MFQTGDARLEYQSFGAFSLADLMSCSVILVDLRSGSACLFIVRVVKEMLLPIDLTREEVREEKRSESLEGDSGEFGEFF